jgi:hypothetical protein
MVQIIMHEKNGCVKQMNMLDFPSILVLFGIYYIDIKSRAGRGWSPAKQLPDIHVSRAIQTASAAVDRAER